MFTLAALFAFRHIGTELFCVCNGVQSERTEKCVRQRSMQSSNGETTAVSAYSGRIYFAQQTQIQHTASGRLACWGLLSTETTQGVLGTGQRDVGSGPCQQLVPSAPTAKTGVIVIHTYIHIIYVHTYIHTHT